MRRPHPHIHGSTMATALVVAMLVASTSDGQQGISPDQFSEQHDLQAGFESPHTKWAKPYAGGKTRVAFFCGAYQYQPRFLIIEPMQRFEIEPTAVYAATRYAAGFFKNEPMVLGDEMGVTRMMATLDSAFDCYVITERFFGKLLPEEARYKILRRVSEGAGLVVIGADPFELLHADFRDAQPDPRVADLGGVETYGIGRGRAIRFKAAAPHMADVVGAMVGIDLQCEQMGRAILWAARKLPKLRMEIDAPVEVRRVGLDKASIRLIWSEHDRGDQVVAGVWVRGPDGRRVSVDERIILREAGGTARLRFPKSLAGGAWSIEAQATADGVVESWAVRRLTVQSDVSIGLTFDRGGRKNSDGSRERGEPITGRVAIGGVADMAGAVLRLEAIDAHGRILYRHDRAARPDMGFVIPTAKSTPSLLRIGAELRIDGRAVGKSSLPKRAQHAGHYMLMTTRNHERFNFLVWGKTYNQKLRTYMAQSLADLGVTAQLETVTDWESAAGGLSWVAYATGIRQQLEESGVSEHGSWSDDAAMNEWVEKVVAGTQPARDLGALIYSLGDENDTLLADRSERDLIAYREFLGGVYPNIDALNESWGARFASFDEVTLSNPDDLSETTALQAGNTPRWWDRRTFMRHNYAMLCRRFQNAFEKVDPGARVGFEGAGWMDDNIDLLARSVRFWGPYSHQTMQVVSSITGPDFLAGQWGHGWRLALHGSRMFGWWRVDNEGAVHSSLTGPDMAIRPMHRAEIDNLRVWLEGLGMALMHWQRQDDGVVMLHSFASANATQIAAGPSYGRMAPWTDDQSSHGAWHRNLRAAGRQFRYVTDGMLDRGEWDGRDDKLLILSRAEALSESQAQVIRGFVRAGGTVIADVRPGLFNERMKPQDAGQLDDLFGVRHTGNFEAVKRPLRFDGGTPVSEAPQVEVNPGLEPAGGTPAEALGDTPAIIFHQVGRGRAILLNFTMRSFPKLDAADAPAGAVDLFESLLDTAGVSSRFTATDGDGRRLRHIEIMRWRSGRRQIVAFFRPKIEGDTSKAKQSVVCRLGDSQIVTDLRTGASSRSTTWQTELAPGDATVLLLTSERPQPPQISIPAVVRRGSVARFRVEVAGKVHRVLRVRARSPDGREARPFRRMERFNGESIEMDFPIAINEAVGAWSLTATDVTTGLKSTARFNVE
jgi:hypothetical protein